MTTQSDTLVSVENVSKSFTLSRSLSDVFNGRHPKVDAVSEISFTLKRGETIGIVGESGCGKTTLGRMLLKLITPTGGAIRFDGADINALSGESELAFRRRAQLVFQNPFDALNPHFTIRRSLYEPLLNTRVPAAEHDRMVGEAMVRVQLDRMLHLLDSYPHQLSGGQLQRVVLARALVLQPDFIVADEPVSMLDVSVRAGILNVLREVRDTMGLAAVFISHDLALVRYVCERTITMYLGAVVEDGPTKDVIAHPLHPYTRALVQAVPVPNVDQSHDPLPLIGAMPDARNPPAGCRFSDRCPLADDGCRAARPPLRPVGPGRRVACFKVPAFTTAQVQ
ncbi:ABC transporter ATP-binding protein [Ketogulonicigenium vulgare]|uniref:ABC-type oligopeptide transport system, ATPase component n=1 Tax=Ketogulonicigenium vulgare (strain WSH-001) TaxID=759362 RepID=F9YBS4_KETVW|nr:ABC transporter ATP-binding protein [Ketogulonicigenium vulgare]AEM42826.1 ABC-type oligopeptide transport system, ATPase component [Ketogulonicigenium vulgare WSH-001]ALJ82745.1 oligopeptide ABC transporter ATP-binding protein [Ketogulonicigenium vulgare]